MSDIMLQPSCKGIWGHFYFCHGCFCANFFVEYEIFDDAGNSHAGRKQFGSVDVSCQPGQGGGPDCRPDGCRWDEVTGRKKIISVNEPFARIVIYCECTTPGNKLSSGGSGPNARKCSESFPDNNCHEGMAIQITDDDRREIATLYVQTSSPAEITYCEIFQNAAP